MSAKTKPSEEPVDEKVDLFIAPFQSDYSTAISAAREAAATTATSAWQANYRHNIDAHRKTVKSCIESIQRTCDMIDAGDTYEDAEKGIRESVKFLAEERIRFGAWRSRAVRDYEASAKHCQEIITTARRKATDEERNNPLLNIDLLLAVNRRLDTWPTAEWDDEYGVVTVNEAG